MKKAIITIFAVIVSVGLVTIHKSYTVETPTPKKALPQAVSTPEQAVAMLNELIAKNGAFSVKIGHHELPLKVKLWQRKGAVKLPTNIPWETFKKDVHQFGVDLHALLEKDEKGAYYHIEALTKDAALYKALSQMNQGFPKAPAGNGKESLLKIGKQPKLGLLTIINLYANMFYQQKLLEQLKGFSKQFEERAKKLRFAAEEAQKAAEKGAPSSRFDDFEYAETDIDFPDYSMDFETEVGVPEEVEDFGEQPETREEEITPEVDLKDFDIDWGF